MESYTKSDMDKDAVAVGGKVMEKHMQLNYEMQQLIGQCELLSSLSTVIFELGITKQKQIDELAPQINTLTEEMNSWADQNQE